MSDQISGALTVNLGIIRGGGEELSLTLDLRWPVTARYEDFADRLMGAMERGGFAGERTEGQDSIYMPPESPLVQALSKVYREQTGQEAELLSIGGRHLRQGMSQPGGLRAPVPRTGDDGAPAGRIYGSGHPAEKRPDDGGRYLGTGQMVQSTPGALARGCSASRKSLDSGHGCLGLGRGLGLGADLDRVSSTSISCCRCSSGKARYRVRSLTSSAGSS